MEQIHFKRKKRMRGSNTLVYKNLFVLVCVLLSFILCSITEGAPGLVPPFIIHTPSSSPLPSSSSSSSSSYNTVPPPPPSPQPPSPPYYNNKNNNKLKKTYTSNTNSPKKTAPTPSDITFNMDTAGGGIFFPLLQSQQQQQQVSMMDGIRNLFLFGKLLFMDDSQNLLLVDNKNNNNNLRDDDDDDDDATTSFSRRFLQQEENITTSSSPSSGNTTSATTKEEEEEEKEKIGPNWWVELKAPTSINVNDLPLNRRSGSSIVYQILKQEKEEEEEEEIKGNKNKKEGGKKKEYEEDKSNPPYGRRQRQRRQLKQSENEYFLESSSSSGRYLKEKEQSFTNTSLSSSSPSPATTTPQTNTKHNSTPKKPPIDNNNKNNNNNNNNNNNIACEYMITSGGFTDNDWSTFPIWAFDMSTYNPLNYFTSSSDSDSPPPGEFLNGGNYYSPSSTKNPWTDLTHLNDDILHDLENNNNDDDDDEEEETKIEMEKNKPSGRVGHMTSISNDGYLNVFGGLLYKGKNFSVEKAPYVWRSKIVDLIPPCAVDVVAAAADGKKEEEGDGDEDEDGEEEDGSIPKSLVWEKIRPNIVVDDLPSFYQDFDSVDTFEKDSDDNENDTSENDNDSDEEEEEDDDDEETNNNNQPPNRKKQRRTSWTIVEKNTNSQDSTNSNTESSSTSSSYLDDPSIYLSRGEAQGGHWSTTNSLVIYGGLHVTEIPNPHHHSYMKTIQIDQTTGDVWLYQYDTQTFYLLASYPPAEWQRDGKTGKYPVARTSHAATILNDELIVHGGMAMEESRNNWDGSTNWDPLSDVWVFDLKKRVWRERVMIPALARSYHSLVGWDDGSVAAFGGFRTAQTVGGEPIAFVFSDTIVSHPSNAQWMKASYPEHAQYTTPSATNFPAVTISNRLEHNAVLSKDGLMYVWGGRFKSVDQIMGTWALNVFGSNTAVEFEEALPDGLEAYEAELEALHLLVGVMLFMSVMFTALYGTLRRHTEDVANGNGGGGANGGTIFARSRRGLSREAIDALPVKTYNRSAAKAAATVGAEATVASMPPGDDNENDENEKNNDGEENMENVGLENNQPVSGANSGVTVDQQSSPLGNEAEEEEEEEECCPICLVEYEDGDEVRHLPCNHEFHVDCIDAWLEAHTSCPACRHALSNSVSETGPSSIRQAANMMLGVDDDDMFMSDIVRANLGGYFRNEERREEEERQTDFDRSLQARSLMYSLGVGRFVVSPESAWFSTQHRMQNDDDGSSTEDEGRTTSNDAGDGGDARQQSEHDGQATAEQEYIPRENNPEEIRSYRGLSRLGIPRHLRLQRRRRGGATEMVTIRRRDNSNSGDEPELTIV